MPMIEIWDGTSVELGKLLDLVGDQPALDWSVMEVWAIARDDGTDLVALERRAAASSHGLTMSAAALRELAGELFQVVDGIVVGYRDRRPDRGDEDLRSTATVVIEAIDSTFWRVYARDKAITERMRHHYSDVRDVVPEVAIPAVHEES